MDNQIEEKYKATKLWNDAIRAFRNQMPVKQHRKHFKSFSDTFTGTEAVDWLHGYLSAKASATSSNDCLDITKRPQTGLGKVTREQTLALINKFYDHGLFEPARTKFTDKPTANCRIKDDNTLYKFSDLSPSKIARTPLALKNNSRADVNAVNGDGSKTPTKKTFFNARPIFPVTPISYRKINEPAANGQAQDGGKLNVEQAKPENNEKTPEKFKVIDDLLAMQNGNGCSEKTALSTAFSARQNSVRLKGEKISESEKQAFPQLHLVARQLSLEETENVWKTLTLTSLRQLLRMDDHAFDDAAFASGRDICHNAKHYTPRGVTKVNSKLDDLPSWTLQAMKCLANWPWKNSELNWPCYPGFERDVFATVLDFFATQPNPLIPFELQELMLEILNRVEYMDVQQWDANHDELIQSPPSSQHSSANGQRLLKASTDDDISVETEFGPRSPITRLIEREPPRSRGSVASAATRKQDELLAGLRQEFEANVRSLEEILSTLPGLVRSPRLLRELRELRTKTGKQQSKEESSSQGLRTTPDRENLNACFDGRVLTALVNLPGARFSVASTLTGSFDFFGSPTPTSHSAHGVALSFFTRAGRQTACQALQLSLLFLPPKNRRWLQLLLRMMSKICLNYCLRLDKHNAASNRSIVLEAYCDVVVTGNRDGGLGTAGNMATRHQRMKLISFLLDAMNEIFAPPMELISNVEARIRQMQRTKICYNSAGQNPGSLAVNTNDDQIAFCERISPKEYEQQAAFSSRRALEKLLDSIADDKKLSAGEKKKRLKRFKDSYPDLFYQRFPNKAAFETLIKTSSSSLYKGSDAKSGSSFGKLVSLRL